ncbi:AI-2E family transporter [Pricia sp. S334]|uniref:AI-2E family transporter n=1 Tax=Pricia mediterranea TaxID=3076079 RepID=A0ABU3L1A9_9FLAO|nr:AI-2E family transporter [Pricia sp. S334]MDT7827510.1 AI-2E family transporter [Pricia sp. S334]
MKDKKIHIDGNKLLSTLALVVGIMALMHFGSPLLLPLTVAVMLASLLNGPTERFKKWGIPGWAAITLSILLSIVIFLLLSWLISTQFGNMIDQWETIKEKASQRLEGITQWLNDNLNVDYKQYVRSNIDFMGKLETLLSMFASSLSTVLSQSFIILIYVILLLMQKSLFVRFFKRLASNESAMGNILEESSDVITNYLAGKGKMMVFLFIIYFIGFKVGGVPFALFLALFATLFSIIPYVGNIIGGGIAIILSYLYSGATPALIVIGVIAAAQVIENYVLTPWIIGDEIDLNPFVTIFGVILLSWIWGLVGAIIALPVVGVLKVIFEHTQGMEAYALLLRKKE